MPEGLLPGLALKRAEPPYYTVFGNDRTVKLSDAVLQINSLEIEELEIKSQTLEEVVSEYFE